MPDEDKKARLFLQIPEKLKFGKHEANSGPRIGSDLAPANLIDRLAVFFVDDRALYLQGRRHFTFVD